MPLSICVFSPILCLFISIILGFVWMFVLTAPDNIAIDYSSAIVMFVLSALIESIAEPIWILCQRYELVATVAFVQSVHIFMQRFIVALLVYTRMCTSLNAFVNAQVYS